MTHTQKQKRITLIIGIISIVLFLAYSICQNINFKTEWKYAEYNDGYKLISFTQAFNDNTKEITIPSQYEGKNVIAIADKAFYQNNKITKVIIPDTVTEMGASIFKECKNLETVDLGKGVVTMGGECFKDCKSLTSIVLPESLVELSGETFMGCKLLKTVELSPNITEIRGNTFENCSSLESIVIPVGVTRIAAHAFYGCSSLSYAYIPDTVTEIGSSAFRLCDSLTSIELPKGVSINERAFKESPTKLLEKTFTDEQLMEVRNEAWNNWDKVYFLYNTEKGKDEIYCKDANTLIASASVKYKEKYLNSAYETNDLLEITDYDELVAYIDKAKASGVTKVILYVYSQKGTDIIGEHYFEWQELTIDEFSSMWYEIEE